MTTRDLSAAITIRRIKLDDYAELIRDDYPHSSVKDKWMLMRGRNRIRYLDMFESLFIDTAIVAALNFKDQSHDSQNPAAPPQSPNEVPH